MRPSIWSAERDELLRVLWMSDPLLLVDEIRKRLNELPWHHSIRSAGAISHRARNVLGLQPRRVYGKPHGSNDPREPKPVKAAEPRPAMPPSRTRDPSSAAILLARDVERTLVADIDFDSALAWGQRNKVPVGKAMPPALVIAAINRVREEKGLVPWRLWRHP